MHRPLTTDAPPRRASQRRLFAESLFCGFALLAVAVWADVHSGYALLATLPAVVLGLPVFLLHWLLPGGESVSAGLRRVRRTATPVLCSLLALGFCRLALRRGAPENRFRAVTGIPLPAGISNLQTRLLFGPMGGSGQVYFEGNRSVVAHLISSRRLERDYSEADLTLFLSQIVPTGFPQPAHSNWTYHRTSHGSGRDGSLQVFSSTNGPGVYAFGSY